MLSKFVNIKKRSDTYNFWEWFNGKNTSTEIEVKMSSPGLHSWSNIEDQATAYNDFEDVKYLKYLHRHTFHFTLRFQVSHDDRDLEFIQVRNLVYQLLHQEFYDAEYSCLNFRSRSCEMICKEVLRVLYDYKSSLATHCTRIEVSEDNEFTSILRINS